MPTLHSVLVVFADSKYNYTTNVSATATAESIRKHFVGMRFNLGAYPVEDFQVCINVCLLDVMEFEPSSYYVWIGAQKFEIYHNGKRWYVGRMNLRLGTFDHYDAAVSCAYLYFIAQNHQVEPISSENTLSTQLQRITGDTWNVFDFRSISGGDPTTMEPFMHLKTGLVLSVPPKQ